MLTYHELGPVAFFCEHYNKMKIINNLISFENCILLNPIQISQEAENISGLMQERRNSIVNALELRLFCTNPWISSEFFLKY